MKPGVILVVAALVGAPVWAKPSSDLEIKPGPSTIATRFDRKGTAVTGTFTLDLSRTRFEPDAFPELKQLWSVTTRAASPRMNVTDP
jgi:hypothetical protein